MSSESTPSVEAQRPRLRSRRLLRRDIFEMIAEAVFTARQICAFNSAEGLVMFSVQASFNFKTIEILRIPAQLKIVVAVGGIESGSRSMKDQTPWGVAGTCIGF